MHIWGMTLILCSALLQGGRADEYQPCDPSECRNVSCENCTRTFAEACPVYATTLFEGAESLLDCVCVPGAALSPSGCAPCGPGAYAPLPNATACTPCLYGVTANTTGATNASACAAPVYHLVLHITIPAPLNISGMAALTRKISGLLGVPAASVSISQANADRRRLLATTQLTVTVDCADPAQLGQFDSVLTQGVVAGWFSALGLPAPSSVSVELISPTTTPLAATSATPAPTPPGVAPPPTTPVDTPPPADQPPASPLMVIYIAAAAAGLGALLGLGALVYYTCSRREAPAVAPTHEQVLFGNAPISPIHAKTAHGRTWRG